MIKTNDGTTIYLDNDFEVNGRPGVSWVINVCWMFLAVFVMGPLQMLVVERFSGLFLFGVGVGWWSFLMMVIVCLGCVVLLRIGLFRVRHPMAYHWLQILGGSFRIFYVSAFLWVSLSSMGWWAYLVVIMLWIFSELTNCYEIRRVSDDEISKAFRKRFKIHPVGFLLYNPIANVKDLHSWGRAPWVKWRDRFETFGAAIGVIIGPALFIRSQLYRDNFEPRFMIMTGVALAMAMALRHMTTEVAIARRALKLKQQEG
ncbi:hypothetical protein ACUY1T_02540 [Billgrantia sp. Q4P2]|uniref:hypothetical protein n=1 Tax=Billgrantia sp. Q4P2 TaxID=3463857 RepID=UPI004056CB53